MSDAMADATVEKDERKKKRIPKHFTFSNKDIAASKSRPPVVRFFETPPTPRRRMKPMTDEIRGISGNLPQYRSLSEKPTLPQNPILPGKPHPPRHPPAWKLVAQNTASLFRTYADVVASCYFPPKGT